MWTGDRACPNQGPHAPSPGLGTNPQPFGYGTMLQPTEPYWSELTGKSFSEVDNILANDLEQTVTSAQRSGHMFAFNLFFCPTQPRAVTVTHYTGSLVQRLIGLMRRLVLEEASL